MSFSLDLEKFAKKAGNKANTAVKLIALNIFARTTYRTPVDTGVARGNWQLTFGSASTGYDLTKKDSNQISTGASGGQMEKAWQSNLGFAALQGWKTGDIYLTNNLPYIGKLEFGTYGKGAGVTEKTGGTGYSIQAPSGMVRITMREAQSVVNEALKRLEKQ